MIVNLWFDKHLFPVLNHTTQWILESYSSGEREMCLRSLGIMVIATMYMWCVFVCLCESLSVFLFTAMGGLWTLHCNCGRTAASCWNKSLCLAHCFFSSLFQLCNKSNLYIIISLLILFSFWCPCPPQCSLLLLHLLQGSVKAVFCQTAWKDLERLNWVVYYFTL